MVSTEKHGDNESVNHLFIFSPLARYVWNAVRCAFNIGAVPDSAQTLGGLGLGIFLRM